VIVARQPDSVFSLELTSQDLRMLRRAMRVYRSKLARDIRKNPYVPEPGKANVTENNLRHVDEKMSEFEGLLGFSDTYSKEHGDQVLQ
jgi:hypothetical protein